MVHESCPVLRQVERALRSTRRSTRAHPEVARALLGLMEAVAKDCRLAARGMERVVDAKRATKRRPA